MLTRRTFLAASSALIAARPAQAGLVPLLTAQTRILDIKGKAATVYGISGPWGRQGLVLDAGERFKVAVKNELSVPTILHWHGQIPPNTQDGVPDMPLPALQPGEARDYDYTPEPGTYWMHSHIPVQEMNLLAAPLIVRSAADLGDDRQEVVMFLHDFSFTAPEELLAGLAMASGHDMGAMGHKGHDMAAMGDGSAMQMDLNDIAFDAYLTNDRTLDDPEVVTVAPAARLRLRIINAASATNFWIDLGALTGSLVAVDGQPVEPIRATRFPLAMAQRMDILLDLPIAGAFPIFALREGARERTGLVLATQGAPVSEISPVGDSDAPPIDLSLETHLRAVNPLPHAQGDLDMVMLEGTMSPYLWTINGGAWPNHVKITARQGQRREIMFHNMSMMGHPMHLHGHRFQVVDLGAGRFAGAMRDTVYVPPMSAVTIALDPGEAASWMLHCHHMPHLATGMMTEFVVLPG